jgi:hypothetical protein
MTKDQVRSTEEAFVEVHESAATAIKQALAAPVQEPCCYGGINHDCHAGPDCRVVKMLTKKATPPAQSAPVQEPVAIGWDTKTDTPIMGYTTPPAAQRQWVEVEQVKWEGDKLIAKLKEKNT